MKLPKTPSLDKLAEHNSSELCAFMDWLKEYGSEIIVLHTERTVIKYLGLKYQQVEKERRALLKYAQGDL